MENQIKNFIENGEKEFEEKFIVKWEDIDDEVYYRFNVDEFKKDADPYDIKQFISSRQISLIKMIVEMVEKIEVDRCYSCDNAIRDIILSELQPPEIVCARCNGIATIGEYNDGFRDYLCKNCDITFLNDNKQTIIS